jgi:hypothetical protein
LVRPLAGALAFVLLVAACTSTAQETTTTTLPIPSDSIVPEVSDRLLAELSLESLALVAASLRQLEFVVPVQVEILDDDDYRRRVDELAAVTRGIDPDRAASWLQLLGALPPDMNEYTARSRLLATTVAFYDPEASRVLVRAGAGIDPFVESAVVHEMVHALQVQNFGGPVGLPIDGDLGYVAAAIVEGDARRITQQFIGSLTTEDEFRYEDGRLTAAEDAIAIRGSTPPFVLDGLQQPAGDGSQFLRGLSNAEVDQYLADLTDMAAPSPSSEQLLIAGADLEPLRVAVPPLVVPEYELLPVQPTLGVGMLRLLLQRVVDPDLLEAVLIGWGGDHREVLVDGDDVIFAYTYRGEQPTDAQELAAAFRLLLDTQLADGGHASVRVAGDSALVLAASDPGVKDRLDEMFDGFGEEVFLVQLGG